jgi:hypothetical protein
LQGVVVYYPELAMFAEHGGQQAALFMCHGCGE